jgi:transcriptional regulator with XRE-family HTH domain
MGSVPHANAKTTPRIREEIQNSKESIAALAKRLSLNPKTVLKWRQTIARHFIVPLNAPASHLKLIAWFTEGTTGAEIESLVRTYKRAMALPAQDRRGLIETLQQFATLNGARIEQMRRTLLFGDPDTFLKIISEDTQLKFSQEEIGEITGWHKSTVSRKLSRLKSPQTNGDVVHG